MAFFRKKNEYENASNQINNSNKKARERIIFEQLNNDSQQAATLIDQLKAGSPLVIDFERLDVKEGNKMLAFFAGACYASDARYIELRESVFLFARNVDFHDGTLDEFIKNL
ncbi:MAG: cell division protein SepF [bacterium]